MKHAAALPVLMYHHVSPNPGLVTVSPENFRAQMEWLARHGYQTIGCDDLANFLSGVRLPARSVLVTFDDGYVDNFLYAFPTMAQLGLTGTIFLITGRMGDGPVRREAETPSHRECAARIAAGRADEVMLRWSEVERMAQAGIQFHSHTHSHTRWDLEIGDPSQRARRLAEDLAVSRATLKARLGIVSAHLCWPQGYHDDDYRRVAREAGFNHLYTTERGTCTPATDATSIPRIVIKNRQGAWFGRRMWLYRHPRLADVYLTLRGR